VFRAHRYSLALENGRLTGAGARFLLDASRDAQFFVIGESHYVAQIPRFAEALFSSLHSDRGYNYYAVEFGPVITGMLSAASVPARSSQHAPMRSSMFRAAYAMRTPRASKLAAPLSTPPQVLRRSLCWMRSRYPTGSTSWIAGLDGMRSRDTGQTPTASAT